VRLQELTDKQEIVELLYTYAAGLDSRDWELLGSVFVEDGVADYTHLELGVNTGREAIVGLCRDTLVNFDATQHLIGNPLVVLAGDRATARCSFQAQHRLVGAPGGDNFIVAGTYEDELVRTPDGWRIARRTLIPSWFEGNATIGEAAAARSAEKAMRGAATGG
jgi:3-phenylpropionate/cinnamic acid dioxygenase small subunit